jgi:uncharacterized protein (DUF1501 family)
MNRRFFLHKGALAVAGTTAMPNFLVRSVLAQANGAPGQRLVVIFQRGAADGLNVVVPYQEKNYYKMRPSIAIPQGSGVRSGWIFRTASLACRVQAALRPGPTGDCARLRIAGHEPVAL